MICVQPFLKNSCIFVVLLCSLMALPSVSEALDTSLPVEALDSQGPLQQCADVLKECFVQKGYQKNQCFFSRGQHPFCEGTVLGKLALKRWTFSQNERNISQFHALSGPRMVDTECLNRFENRWSASLLNEQTPPAVYQQLLSSLDECARVVQDSSNQ